MPKRWKIQFIGASVIDHAHHIPLFILTETQLGKSHLEAGVKVRNSIIWACCIGRRKEGVLISLYGKLSAEINVPFAIVIVNQYVYNKMNDLAMTRFYRPPHAPLLCFKD